MNRKVSLRTAIAAIVLVTLAAATATIYAYMEYSSARFDRDLYDSKCHEIETKTPFHKEC